MRWDGIHGNKARLHFQMFEGWKMKIRQFRCSFSFFRFLNDVRETKSGSGRHTFNQTARRQHSWFIYSLTRSSAARQAKQPARNFRHGGFERFTSDKLTGHEQEGRTAGRDKDRSNLEKNRQTNYTRPPLSIVVNGRFIFFLKRKKRRETILKNLRWDFRSGSIMWRE
jgi:hypothetical protein